MTKLKNILALLTISYMGIIQAQYTAIPDPIFEEFLISEGMDDVIDGQVLTTNINDRTHLVINETPPHFLIEDLTGIQDFSALEFLDINYINCTTINFGNLLNLEALGIYMDTSLEEVDVSGCINLEHISLSENNLNTIDVSQNSSLDVLGLSNNNLSTVDVSQNPNLTQLTISNNNLNELDIRNGTNTTIIHFFMIGNPNLQCVFVDDAEYSTANWTDIDPTTTFVETQEQCDVLSVGEAHITIFKIYPNPASTFFKITPSEEITEVEIIDLTGKVVKLFTSNLNNYSVKGVSKGVYILNIKTNFGSTRRKLIIQN